MSSETISTRAATMYLQRRARMVCACGLDKGEDVQGCENPQWKAPYPDMPKKEWLKARLVHLFNKHSGDNVGLSGQIYNAIEELRIYGNVRQSAPQFNDTLPLFSNTGEGLWRYDVESLRGTD